MPCSPASADDWKQRTTPPGCAVPAKELWQSPVPLPDTSTGHANTYLPEGSTLERLLWAIQHLVAAGMYVLVDYHPMFSEQVALDRQQYVERWAALWRAVTSLPGYAQDLCGRVLLDLLNEPDALGLRWEPAGGKPGAAQCSGPHVQHAVQPVLAGMACGQPSSSRPPVVSLPAAWGWLQQHALMRAMTTPGVC